MEILEEKYIETERYGTIRFVRTEKGWTYQYDETLVMAVDYCEDDGEESPYYLDEDIMLSENYIPEIDCLDDDCFYETYEQAYDEMLGDMSNNHIMGLIATYC